MTSQDENDVQFLLSLHHMRTTLNIEEEALLVIKRYADEREISLGRAASDLIHRGAESIPQFNRKNGWVIFDAPASEDMVREGEEAEYDEEFRRALSPRR
jgi:hypothetical protein